MAFIKLSALLSERKKKFLLDRYKGLSKAELIFLEKTDPTDKGDFAEWLLKNLRSKSILNEDSDKTKALLTKFNRLKNSPKFKQNHSIDINSYTPSELWKTIDEGELSKKERYRLRDTQAKEIQMGPFTVYKVESVDDAGILGQGTNWCTANNPTLTREYIQQAPLWVVYLEDRPYAQIHGPSEQFMDPSDSPKFFTYDSTYDPGVTKPINYVSKDDLQLLKEISKLDKTVEESLYSGVEEKRPPKELDYTTLFKNYSAKEFFLFTKLFEVVDRFPEKWERILFTKTTYPEDREYYFNLFDGPDEELTKIFSTVSEGVHPEWALDYYTFILKTEAPAKVTVRIETKSYSYLLHQAVNGNYYGLQAGRNEKTYYMVMTKILDMKAIKYADPEFEKSLIYLLRLDEEDPEYATLMARYAIGLKKAPMPELNRVIEDQWIPNIPVLRYIRKYYADYLTTDRGSRYIFALMEMAKERDPLLEEKLLHQAKLNVKHRGIARILIQYLTRFKVKNDEALEAIDGNTSLDYFQYLKAVDEPLEKGLEKFCSPHSGWYPTLISEFVEITDTRNSYFEENLSDFFTSQAVQSILSYVHKFKCHLPAQVEIKIFEVGEAVQYYKTLGSRLLPEVEKRMYASPLKMFNYLEAINKSIWDILGNCEKDGFAESGDPFIDLVIGIGLEANRINGEGFEKFMDYLIKKKDGEKEIVFEAWETIMDYYHNPEEIKRALKRAPMDAEDKAKLQSHMGL